VVNALFKLVNKTLEIASSYMLALAYDFSPEKTDNFFYILQKLFAQDAQYGF